MPLDQFVIYMITIALSPLIAVQVTEVLQRRRQRHEGRVRVFRILMSTRAARLSPEHVSALNLIDIEFHGPGKGLASIRAAWKAYLTHLNQAGNASEAWAIKRDDLFFSLLEQMAAFLGYHVDATDLRKVNYFPRGHGEMEEDHFSIRKGLLAVLSHKASIAVDVATQKDPPGA